MGEPETKVKAAIKHLLRGLGVRPRRGVWRRLRAVAQKSTETGLHFLRFERKNPPQ